MYNKENNLSVALGISVPNESCFSDIFGLILDEKNKLWYSDNDKEYQMKRIAPFGMVLFVKGSNNKATSINVCPRKLSHINTIHRVFFESKDALSNLMNIPYEEIKNTSWKYKELAYHNFGHYNLYSITAIHYLSADSSELGVRYFLKDDRNKQYNEISNTLVKLLDDGYGGEENIVYPIDGKSIQSICSKVQKFNPYEVFESYRVEIEHEHVSRVGRDDHFYEYKRYSIKYIDAYLERWFSEKKIQLAFDSGYSSYFTPTIPYKRFYNEENDAKAKAYKEYSKVEHLDCLMKKHYQEIIAHSDAVNKGKFAYHKYEWLPKDIKIEAVYIWLQKIDKPIFSYDRERIKKHYEGVILDNLPNFNKENRKQDPHQ